MCNVTVPVSDTLGFLGSIVQEAFNVTCCYCCLVLGGQMSCTLSGWLLDKGTLT
jgi:hypothetical protein